jgi:hypothetical protein
VFIHYFTHFLSEQNSGDFLGHWEMHTGDVRSLLTLARTFRRAPGEKIK